MNKSCLYSSNPLSLEGSILDHLCCSPQFPKVSDFLLQVPIYLILGFGEPSICSPALDWLKISNRRWIYPTASQISENKMPQNTVF